MTAADAALLVACPQCKARPNQPCSRTRKAAHTARVSRGLSVARRDTYRTHERAWRARRRVDEAITGGRQPDDYDITLGVAGCCCPECSFGDALAWFAALPAAIR